MAPPLSRPAAAFKSKKYDVFISFRGADVRDGFLSHLHQSLKQNQVNAFVDENLERGKEITPSLLNIIEKSFVSIVIFSENYAESSWCLDELVKILECQQKKEQTVLPVFYRVDPSHVQELTGLYGDAIVNHKQEFSDHLGKVRNWSNALTVISNLSGWDSRTVKSDAKLIREIVNNVLKILDHATPSDLFKDGLVGIDSRVNDVRSLLCLESTDVRVVGIWGMGGIGKTTTVDKLFNQIYNRFPCHCFVSNVREKLEHFTIDSLRSEILTALVGSDNLVTGMPGILSSSVRRRLSREKALIVLDDVSDYDQIEWLVGSHIIFGSGSRIIITSRDRQVLKNAGAEIYEVRKLGYFEASQLFNLHAFKQYTPNIEYVELSRLATNYAQGIPLALKVLGSNLYGKNMQEWEDQLDKLKHSSDKKVLKILRISYDGLDEDQKRIFLDIACFFKGFYEDRVIKILRGFYAKCGIRELLDRSLVTISSDKKIGMHDLIQKMGKDVVSEEKDLGKRSRLLNPKDILKVLTTDMETKGVEGILLDMSQIKRIDVSFTVFVKFCSLRYLKFYEKSYHGKNKIFFPDGLKNFPDELRFLQWDDYPLQRLPLQFSLENLVELHMPKSKIKQLWSDDEILGNLKLIDLKGSVDLINIPDFSTVPNLEVLQLFRCKSLVEIPSSIQHLSRLTQLSLSGCISLCSLPSCLPLNIKILNLMGTSIKELPPSIGCLSQLVKLLDLPGFTLECLPSTIGQLTSLQKMAISGCSKLTSLPDTMCNLKSLRNLSLWGCTSLYEFPENLGHLDSLEELYVRSGIKRLPPSICQLRQLRVLSFLECEGLKLPPLTDLPSLRYVCLRDCRLLEFPDSLCSLKSLEELHLEGNDFEIIPTCIKQLSGLRLLDIRDCKRLKYLPELPFSLDDLCARNCISLKSVSTSFLLTAADHAVGHIDFSNCISLSDEMCHRIMDDVLDDYGVIALYIAGSEVLQRMQYRSFDRGSSLSFKLGWHDSIGLSFSVVVASSGYPYRGLFDIGCTAKFTDDFGHSRTEDFCLFGDEDHAMDFQSDTVFLWRDQIFDFHSEHRFSEASLQFFIKYSTKELMIVKCGFHPIYNQDKRTRDEDDENGIDMEEEPPYKRLKESEEMIDLILKLSHCLLNNEDEEDVCLAEENQELKRPDLNTSGAVLLMVNVCLASTSQVEKPRPSDIIFALMTITVCLNLLSFSSSLSIHGFALSL